MNRMLHWTLHFVCFCFWFFRFDMRIWDTMTQVIKLLIFTSTWDTLYQRVADEIIKWWSSSFHSPCTDLSWNYEIYNYPGDYFDKLFLRYHCIINCLHISVSMSWLLWFSILLKCITWSNFTCYRIDFPYFYLSKNNFHIFKETFTNSELRGFLYRRARQLWQCFYNSFSPENKNEILISEKEKKN